MLQGWFIQRGARGPQSQQISHWSVCLNRKTYSFSRTRNVSVDIYFNCWRMFCCAHVEGLAFSFLTGVELVVVSWVQCRSHHGHLTSTRQTFTFGFEFSSNVSPSIYRWDVLETNILQPWWWGQIWSPKRLRNFGHLTWLIARDFTFTYGFAPTLLRPGSNFGNEYIKKQTRFVAQLRRSNAFCCTCLRTAQRSTFVASGLPRSGGCPKCRPHPQHRTDFLSQTAETFRPSWIVCLLAVYVSLPKMAAKFSGVAWTMF
jgi:hypothetical protein